MAIAIATHISASTYICICIYQSQSQYTHQISICISTYVDVYANIFI